MSGEGDATPVEQEYHREERYEHKTMDSKQPGAKFSSNILRRALDDNRSAGSGKSRQALPADLFFQNAAAKVAAPIGEASLSGRFPLCDKPWSFWLAGHHPNDSKLSEYEKCNIEGLNQTIRYQNVAIDKLELHQGQDADETIQVALVTVLGALQCIYIADVILIQVYARRLWPEMEAHPGAI